MAPNEDPLADLRRQIDAIQTKATTHGRAEVEAMQANNDVILAGLRNQGLGVGMDALLQVRMIALCEELFGDMDDPRRLAFEVKLVTAYTEKFAEWQSVINRAKLAQGVNGAKLPPRPGG